MLGASSAHASIMQSRQASQTVLPMSKAKSFDLQTLNPRIAGSEQSLPLAGKQTQPWFTSETKQD